MPECLQKKPATLLSIHEVLSCAWLVPRIYNLSTVVMSMNVEVSSQSFLKVIRDTTAEKAIRDRAAASR